MNDQRSVSESIVVCFGFTFPCWLCALLKSPESYLVRGLAWYTQNPHSITIAYRSFHSHFIFNFNFLFRFFFSQLIANNLSASKCFYLFIIVFPLVPLSSCLAYHARCDLVFTRSLRIHKLNSKIKQQRKENMWKKLSSLCLFSHHRS